MIVQFLTWLLNFLTALDTTGVLAALITYLTKLLEFFAVPLI